MRSRISILLLPLFPTLFVLAACDYHPPCPAPPAPPATTWIQFADNNFGWLMAAFVIVAVAWVVKR